MLQLAYSLLHGGVGREMEMFAVVIVMVCYRAGEKK